MRTPLLGGLAALPLLAAGCVAAPPEEGPTSEAAEDILYLPPSVQFMNGLPGLYQCMSYLDQPTTGAPMVLGACTSTASFLAPTSDGRLHASSNYGMCLSVFANDTNAGVVELQPCGNTLFSQSWTFARGRVGLYTSGGTKCLAVSSSGIPGAKVSLKSCDYGAITQYFVPVGTQVQISNPAGALATDCMSAGLNGVPTLQKCSLSDSKQRFVLTRSGQIMSPSGQCLGTYDAQGGVVMQSCNGASTQTWWALMSTWTIFGGHPGGGVLAPLNGSLAWGTPVVNASSSTSVGQWNITLAQSAWWTYPGLTSD